MFLHGSYAAASAAVNQQRSKPIIVQRNMKASERS
jgi:hypothetical protein